MKKLSQEAPKELQNDLFSFFNAHTILIGHGLENDLGRRNLNGVGYQLVITFEKRNLHTLCLVK